MIGVFLTVGCIDTSSVSSDQSVAQTVDYLKDPDIDTDRIEMTFLYRTPNTIVSVFEDRENNVTCYCFKSGFGSGIDCIPNKDLK